MKKVLTSSIFRAVCSIIVGALLIKYPNNTVTGITMFIGILFLLPGVFSILTYFNSRRIKHEIYDAAGKLIAGGKQSFPIVGIGSVILGMLLAVMPGTFVAYLMYVLGFILILGSINQYLSLIHMHKLCRIPIPYYILPTAILLTGLFVLIHPMESAELPLIIIGVCSVVYGISEIINVIKFAKVHQEGSDTIASD